MLTVLIFSLVFVHNLSIKDPRDYKCHVENATEISESLRILNIFLQGTAATHGNLSRTQKVITLECFHLQSIVQVNLYLEKMHGDLRKRREEKSILQSLKVSTSIDSKPATGHSCHLSTRCSKKSQRTFIHVEKVFLKEISNCVLKAKLPNLNVSAEGLTSQHVHQENQTLGKGIPCTISEDILNRHVVTAVTDILIFTIVTGCILFIACYILPLCPVSINTVRSRRSRCVACVPVSAGTVAPILSLKVTEEKPPKSFIGV